MRTWRVVDGKGNELTIRVHLEEDAREASLEVSNRELGRLVHYIERDKEQEKNGNGRGLNGHSRPPRSTPCPPSGEAKEWRKECHQRTLSACRLIDVRSMARSKINRMGLAHQKERGLSIEGQDFAGFDVVEVSLSETSAVL